MTSKAIYTLIFTAQKFEQLATGKVPSPQKTKEQEGTRWAPTSYKWSYGAPINVLIIR